MFCIKISQCFVIQLQCILQFILHETTHKTTNVLHVNYKSYYTKICSTMSLIKSVCLLGLDVTETLKKGHLAIVAYILAYIAVGHTIHYNACSYINLSEILDVILYNIVNNTGKPYDSH